MDDAVLVTGGSNGIGLALAEQFALRGEDLVLVARDEDDLAAAAADLANARTDVETVAMDLADSDAADALVDELDDRGVEVGTLVNNVGIGTYGAFADSDPERERDLLQLNVVVPTMLTRRLLPDLRERDGGVLNVASMAAFAPGPEMATYYASKAYVVSWSQALTAELRDAGVSVTALCPGPVDTEFQERAGMEDARLSTALLQDVEDVARAGYRGLRDGEAVVVPGYANKALLTLTRAAPRSMVRRTAEWLNADR